MTPLRPYRTLPLAARTPSKWLALLGGAWLWLPAQPVAAVSVDPTGVTQLLGLAGSQTSTTIGNSLPPGTITPAQVPAASNISQATNLPPVPPALTAPTATITTSAPQFYDYSANLKSDVFGANLFTGSFTRAGATQFNPDYAVAIGDQIQVRFWGAFDYDAPSTVDPQGNIFLPHVGPVHVLGVHNQDLQQRVEAAAARVFRTNVYSYASLAAAQPVRVFVSGFVNRPGLYNGTSMDSLLHYLDQAGGIGP